MDEKVLKANLRTRAPSSRRSRRDARDELTLVVGVEVATFNDRDQRGTLLYLKLRHHLPKQVLFLLH